MEKPVVNPKRGKRQGQSHQCFQRRASYNRDRRLSDPEQQDGARFRRFGVLQEVLDVGEPYEVFHPKISGILDAGFGTVGFWTRMSWAP
jgi:hypothetical protein